MHVLHGREVQASIQNLTIIYALRFTDLMVQSMHPKQHWEEVDINFSMQVTGAGSPCLILRRKASSMNRTHSTIDTIREPSATDPRLYRKSRFIEENTGRNGISCCIQIKRVIYQKWNNKRKWIINIIRFMLSSINIWTFPCCTVWCSLNKVDKDIASSEFWTP